jgi:hypothetical protein
LPSTFIHVTPPSLLITVLNPLSITHAFLISLHKILQKEMVLNLFWTGSHKSGPSFNTFEWENERSTCRSQTFECRFLRMVEGRLSIMDLTDE